MHNNNDDDDGHEDEDEDEDEDDDLGHANALGKHRLRAVDLQTSTAIIIRASKAIRI
eukprot:CAMPEP_0195006510 /NCGR_PEP_ID=MMETSP0326_2-20130528/6774_1 /TAXON_ID=2866 ORGANISM="Crypthecodinium cohnii, Strain Seligo" /NCGR_SAMPLE_ID=MMETSP0326_2 /ASSEMBLY_ACC=CAM_ASM_000348 /LENGTH=56 /DNA_ID=CAMNT_0040013321 /DNA_START=235 /DNA_END=403 /DNA_ORIENTATION=-